jgi:hypothetical protein
MRNVDVAAATEQRVQNDQNDARLVLSALIARH